MIRRFLFTLYVGALFFLVACGSNATAQPATPTALASATPLPTATTAPSATPQPSRTTAPTATVRATSTRRPTSTPKASATIVVASSDLIEQVVMAADVRDLDLAPLGVADSFSPDQGIYHAVVSIKNAPANSQFKAIWIAVDTNGTLPANKNLGSYQISAKGTHYLDFNYTPSGKMPEGSYQVQIMVNGKLARTIEFTVDASVPVFAAANVTPAPCPSVETAAETPPGFAIGVTLAKDVQGANFDPVQPGRVFAPSDVFHAIVNIASAPSNTNFRVVWYAEDVGNAASCNYLINEGSLTSSGSRNLDFYISPGSKWPEGTYRVEVYVNDVLTLKTNFIVSTNPNAVAPTAAPATTNTQPVTYPAQVVYQDGVNDCIANATGDATDCNPAGVDIRTATISRPSADGPLTIVLELGGTGIQGNSLWVMAYGFDLDRNISTGGREVYPSQHGIGPELYLLYGEVNGQVKEIYKQYASNGSETDVDPSLIQWSWLDDTHLQTVIDPSLIPVERFYLVGDLTVADQFDHFVEDGYLTFPEGLAKHK